MGWAAIQALLETAFGDQAVNLDSYTTIAINLEAGTNQELIAAPGAGKQVWVYGFGITVNASGSVQFKDADGDRSGIMPMSAGIVCPASGSFTQPIMKFGTNRAVLLDIVTSEVDGWLTYGVVEV